MAERIIGFISCLMCAIPFLIISKYDKNSREPIAFWSGDKTLKSKVINVPDYNREMSGLYGKCAYAFLLAGAGCVILPVIGYFMICFECTAGIYFVYRCYKKILGRYS